MSWLKFWKSSKKDPRSRSEIAKSDSFKDEFSGQGGESERDKNGRLRHSMSISRSGRFKQKNKQRSAIIDQPDFFTDSNNANNNSSQKENRERGVQQNVQHVHNTNFEHKRTPPSTCREVSSRQNIANHHFEGQTTVL